MQPFEGKEGAWKPMTMMTTLLPDVDSLFEFNLRIKMSNAEKDLSFFLIDNREEALRIVDGVGEKQRKQYFFNLLMRLGKSLSVYCG